MGFRFRKSVKIGKGVRLNVGKRSAGVSFGGRRGGVSINSRSGARARVSIPGTGISYSTKLGGGKKRKTTFSSAAWARTPARTSSWTAYNANTESRKPKNPPKPPKSPKIYLPCGIIMVVTGILLLFLFWPLGLVAIAIGIYYITCGPKIYADLVAKYKAVHPDYKEGT